MGQATNRLAIKRIISQQIKPNRIKVIRTLSHKAIMTRKIIRMNKKKSHSLMNNRTQGLLIRLKPRTKHKTSIIRTKPTKLSLNQPIPLIIRQMYIIKQIIQTIQIVHIILLRIVQIPRYQIIL